MTSIVVGNPFVSSDITQAAIARQHYLKRLGEWSFWRKVFSFEYDFGAYLRSAWSRLRATKQGDPAAKPPSSPAQANLKSKYFIDNMLSGLQQFDGAVLFLMSGKSLVSKEFDELIARSPAWKKAYSRQGNQRIDLPEADQAFSSQDSKEQVNIAILEWVRGLSEHT